MQDARGRDLALDTVMYTYIYIYILMYMCTYIYTPTYTHTQVLIYIYIQVMFNSVLSACAKGPSDLLHHCFLQY